MISFKLTLNLKWLQNSWLYFLIKLSSSLAWTDMFFFFFSQIHAVSGSDLYHFFLQLSETHLLVFNGLFLTKM